MCCLMEWIGIYTIFITDSVSCSNESSTFPFENRRNIYRFAVSPNEQLMVTIDNGIGKPHPIELRHTFVMHE